VLLFGIGTTAKACVLKRTRLFFVGALAILICAGLQRFSRGIGADQPRARPADDGLALGRRRLGKGKLHPENYCLFVDLPGRAAPGAGGHTSPPTGIRAKRNNVDIGQQAHREK
jgi:hypothetical protein